MNRVASWVAFDPRGDLTLVWALGEASGGWAAPQVPGNPVKLPRIPGGEKVEIEDSFERDEELWLEVETGGGLDCWVPAGQVDV